MLDAPHPEFETRLSHARIDVSRGDSALAGVSGDFGRLTRARPLGLIRVRDERELATVIELANSLSARLTLRTGGNSQSGQSLADGSY